MRPVPFDLLVGGDGTKYDLGKFAGIEGPVGDSSWSLSVYDRLPLRHYAPYDFKRFLHDSHGKMGAIIDQSCNVIFWHFRKLLLKYTFQTSHDDEALSSIVIVDNAKLDIPISFLCNSRLTLFDYLPNTYTCSLQYVPFRGMERLEAFLRLLE